ncbi:MAG TPA: hypothetical protein DD473_22810 [Planctomycetaceae bacterium]|nr:hypothetical protein [Planctomycetaceae bacterium]|tara:strand:+ start:352 stop:735 length:384 start_codon:yes stop_codon:yes gene_type:complete
MQTTPQVIVLEATPWVTSGLRREWAGQNVRVLFRDSIDSETEGMILNNCQLLIIDLESLPDTSVTALKIASKMKQQANFLCLINQAQRDHARDLIDLGAVCYLEKPISVHELASRCQPLMLKRGISP